MNKYIQSRLSEVSTWKGLRMGMLALWVASIDYFSINIKLATLISALVIFGASFILIFVSEYNKTKSKIDDIIYAMLAGLLNYDINIYKK